MPLPGSSYTLAIELRLAQVATHARVQEIRARRGRHGVDHRGLARLLEAGGELRFSPMDGARQYKGGVVLELVGREHVAPRADRRQRRVLSRVALRRQRHGLQCGVLREDGLDLLRRRADEAPALLGERCERGPADTRAPERIGAAVHQHRWTIRCFLKKYWSNRNRKTFQNRSPQRGHAGGLRAHHHRLATQIREAAIWAVAAHDQHAGRGIHRRDDAQPGARLRSEEHTSELQSQSNLVCRLLLEKKKYKW